MRYLSIFGLFFIAFSISGCVFHSDSPSPKLVTALPRYHHPLAPSQSQLIAHATTPQLMPYHPAKPRVTARRTRSHPTFHAIIVRLQDLGYLPVTEATEHTLVKGHFRRLRHDAFLWSVPQPLQLAADQYAWNPENPFIRSAIIQFERQNGILHPLGVSEGHLHPQVIRTLFSVHAVRNHDPFQWVYVTKASGTRQPEQLHVWEHGLTLAPASFGHVVKGFAIHNNWVWATVVNTGVLGSTPDGTYPIYQRLPHTTMRGVFPIPISWAAYHALAGQQVPQWGGSSLMQPARGMVGDHPVRWQPYDDPGILWVNYFDRGRGIHYYPRASYGFPQSAGCVEEPYQNAPITYHLLHYGVPVTISSAVFRSHTA